MNNNANWQKLLADALETHSQGEIAQKLGYSRTTVNLVLSGKYRGGTEQFSKRVIEVFGGVICPFLEQKISLEECSQLALGAAPVHNPIKMHHWKTCLTCPKRPNQKRKKS